MIEWVSHRLGDISKWSSGGTPSKSKPEYWDGDLPWISARSMDSNRYDSSHLCITELGLKNGSRLAKKGSILLLVRGSILHQKIQVGIATKDVAFNQDVKAINVDESIIEPWYLLLWFMSKKADLLGLVENTGIGAGKLDTATLQDLIIDVPAPEERKRILLFGRALDDKIELNRQINETLEAMAQALFKSWFVDFDPVIDNALAAGNPIPDVFAERAKQRAAKKPENQSTSATAVNDSSNYQHLFPAEFEFTEEVGWIPLGWEVSQISGFGKVVTGKTPPKNIEDAYSDTGVPFITPTDVDDSVFVFSTNRFLSVQGQESVKKSKLPSGSICVTCIGSQMGKTSIAPFESFSNQQINAIVGCDEVWRNYLFFNLRGRKEEIFLMGSGGSTMPIVNKSTFEKLEVLRPTDNLVAVLGDSFKAPVDTILSNTAENNILAKLRDTLLPKLLSGELRIPDAEKLVQEALL